MEAHKNSTEEAANSLRMAASHQHLHLEVNNKTTSQFRSKGKASISLLARWMSNLSGPSIDSLFLLVNNNKSRVLFFFCFVFHILATSALSSPHSSIFCEKSMKMITIMKTFYQLHSTVMSCKDKNRTISIIQAASWGWCDNTCVFATCVWFHSHTWTSVVCSYLRRSPPEKLVCLLVNVWFSPLFFFPRITFSSI